MTEFAQSPSVLPMDDCIRVYFCTRPPPDSQGQYRSFLAYVDLDKDDLFRVINVSPKPALSLGRTGAFDEYGTNPISVIRDAEEVRVYYAGWTRCESVPFNAAIGVAISHDGGNSFSRLGEGPVLSYSPDEPFLLGSPRVRKFGGRWHLWYAAGKRWLKPQARPEPVYKIRMASSEDGIEWQKYGRDLIVDRLNADECQASADVGYRDGRYHMFFCFRQGLGYKTRQNGYRIGYASSLDLHTWSREDHLAGIDVSEEGWDSEMIGYPHVFTHNGATYMLYQGNELGRFGFGLSILE